MPRRVFPWTVIRSAGLSNNWLNDLATALRQTTSPAEATTVALSALKKQVQQPAFQRGLVMASLTLSEEAEKFAAAPPAFQNKYDRKTAIALWKYLSRAAAKTSPFSHFTTVNARYIPDLSSHDDDSDIFEKSIATPNVALLPLFYEALLPVKAFRDALKLRLNPSVQRQADAVKWLYYNGETEAIQHAEINPALAFLLSQFEDKSIHSTSFSTLSEAIQHASDTDAESADALIYGILDIGLLEPEWPVDGYSPSWCGALYQHLGFLPNADAEISEAAYMLQWLRTAARTLPHQSISEARQTLRDAHAATVEYFGKKGIETTFLTPEGLFYEDVSRPIQTRITGENIEAVSADIQAAWQQYFSSSTNSTRSKISSLARQIIPVGEHWPFSVFYEKYLLKKNAQPEHIPGDAEKPLNVDVGALVQFFQENGRVRAVLNALFPGGEKMSARWRHLFSEAFQQEKIEGSDALFPWHGWSNANFHASDQRVQVIMPGSRRKRPENALAFDQIGVVHDPITGAGLINLTDGSPLVFYDAGLESMEEKPPFAQVLWWLGTPDVSLQRLMSSAPEWQSSGRWAVRERFEYRSIVLARKAWRINAAAFAAWLSLPSEAFMEAVRDDMQAAGLPEVAFLQLDGKREKPQLFMLLNPLCYMDLQKKLKTYQGNLVFTEMLPGLNDNHVQNQAGEALAAEWVIQQSSLAQ
ncbi:MAG: lantibiotic dehydratase [Saprospiraceae bacterium]|nr:lantibiotic dehydratase [Saprospiraceae bacterium]